MTGLNEDSRKFLKYWREQYEWPRNSSRKAGARTSKLRKPLHKRGMDNRKRRNNE